MRTQKITAAVLAAVCVCALFPGPSRASQKPAKTAPGESGVRSQLQHKVEQMIIWEISNTLTLPQNKEDKLFDALRAHFREKRKLAALQFSAMKELREAYAAKDTTDAKVKTALDRLLAAQDDQMRLEIDLQKKLKTFLSPREQAAFVIEWPGIIGKARGMIQEHRQGKGKHIDEGRKNK